MTTTEQAEQNRTVAIDIGALPVGAALRARREQLGWSLADVAVWLRIKLAYLEALEGGQVSKLPGNAYAFGFLRAYSGVLGLDAEDMSRRFRHESKEINRKPDLSFPAPVPERGVPAGAVVLLGVLVVVGAYAGWYELTAHEHGQAHVVPPVPAALLPYAGRTVTPAPSPQVATVMPGPGQTPSPLPAALPAATATVGQAPGPVAAMVAPAQVPVQVPVQVAPPVESQATSPAASTPSAAPTLPAGTTAATAPALSQPAAAVAGEITVKAVAQSWVQARDTAGKVIYDHVLQAGDSWVVPAAAGAVTLTTGNAGGVTLSADGTTTPVLGRNGAVRRNIPLDAASIRDGSVAVAAATVKTGSAVAIPGGRSAAPRHPAPAQPAGDDAADSLNARQLQTAPTH